MNLFATVLCRWQGHPSFERRPGLDVLYACGEDGAWAWTCVRCGAKVLIDSTNDPNTFSRETIEALIVAAKSDPGTLIGGVQDDCPMR